MRLALVTDDYLPNSTRVGAKMLHELACEMQAKGHLVTIITAAPSNQQVALTEDELDGVSIWRFQCGALKDISHAMRALNETLMSFKAWSAIKHKVASNRFDGVIYYSPSIFFGPLVEKLKKCCACKAYLILRDMFPQWVIDNGMISEGSLITRYFRYFENRSYAAADTIGLMSPKNEKLFQQLHPKYSHTEVLFNWASTTPYISNSKSIREKYILQDKVIFFYGGNIGHAQDMANLMRLVVAMKAEAKAHFLFVGQGDEVELIQNIAKRKQLNNFTLLPSVSQDEFKNILSEVDVGLFSLAKTHTAHNFPGKLLGYMVQSLPILGSVNSGSDLVDMINDAQAGLTYVNGDDHALLQATRELLENVPLRNNLGQNAYKLLLAVFSVETAARQIEISLR